MSQINGPRSTTHSTQPVTAQRAQPTPAANAPAHATPVPAWQAAMDLTDVVEARATAAAAAAPGPGDVATKFYEAFVRRDVDDMEKLYAPDVKFEDAIFRYDDRAGTMGMWRKLMQNDSSRFTYKLERVEGNVAIGKWVADYELNGRKVHNEVESRLTVVDGKITRHQDKFPLGKWAKQALPLGPLADFPPVQWLLKHVLRQLIG